MQVGQLTVSIRNNSGKGPARQLRASGKVPGVFYGNSAEGPIAPFSIEVDVKALKAALDPVRRRNTVIEVTVEDGGQKVRSLSALLKDYQIDPLRRDVTHVDLLAIDPTKKIVAEVPLEFVGKPKGAVDGGQLHTVMRSIEVKCVPADIPIKLTLDISEVEIGDVLHVSDVALPDGVATVTSPREAVVTMSAPQVEVPTAAETAAAEAAAAAAEGAAAAPAAEGGEAKDAKDAKAKPAKK